MWGCYLSFCVCVGVCILVGCLIQLLSVFEFSIVFSQLNRHAVIELKLWQNRVWLIIYSVLILSVFSHKSNMYGIMNSVVIVGPSIRPSCVTPPPLPPQKKQKQNKNVMLKGTIDLYPFHTTFSDLDLGWVTSSAVQLQSKMIWLHFLTCIHFCWMRCNAVRWWSNSFSLNIWIQFLRGVFVGKGNKCCFTYCVRNFNVSMHSNIL